MTQCYIEVMCLSAPEFTNGHGTEKMGGGSIPAYETGLIRGQSRMANVLSKFMGFVVVMKTSLNIRPS